MLVETFVDPGRFRGTCYRAANWAEQEFGSVWIYDNRLKQRLYTIAQDFYNKRQANIPEACGTHAGTVGTYRFMKNKKVTMDLLLKAHTEVTIERIREHQVYLSHKTLPHSTTPTTLWQKEWANQHGE